MTTYLAIAIIVFAIVAAIYFVVCLFDVETLPTGEEDE